jgi:hypothetical protein
VPLIPAPPEAGFPGLVTHADPAGIRALAAHQAVRLTGLELPAIGPVELDLHRIDVERRAFAFEVDGVPRSDLLADLDLSVWRGTVVGLPDSTVVLGFSNAGSRGWIHTGEELVHVLPRPAPGPDWHASHVLLALEPDLVQAGAVFDFACGQDVLFPAPRAAREWPAPPTQQLLGGNCSLREAKVALTSDFELYQQFNNLPALTAYVATLFSVISDVYETQANTTLTFPYVAFYTTPADPWTATTASGALQQLQAAWGASIPNGGRVGQLISGANLGGGVGELAALCGLAFSVAGNMNGDVPFPLVQGPSNWDFIVCAHEIGHNFGAVHTHDYCPPVDQCAPSSSFGGCQTAQVCTNQGTIMSYCHLCSGGTANVQTLFHANSQAQMLVESNCLPYFVRVVGDHPAALAPDVPVVLNATVVGDDTAYVRVHYRYYGGPFTSLVMTTTGPGTHTITLPPPACNATPELYYETLGACALSRDPELAPTTLLSVPVGTPITVLDDGFQTDTGWTTSSSGATAGFWQRGVPVNDPGTTFDPPADFDGSGQCWLTGNALGNSDVDNGSVTLTSPALDLSGGGATIAYAYWLRLSSSNGTDRMLVEISSNGTSGPWTAIATHSTDANVWRTHSIPPSALGAAGVTLTANMRVRVTVNDGGTQGTVEAAFDAFEASKLACSGVADSFCRGDGSQGSCPCDNQGATGRGCSNSVHQIGGGLAASGSRSVSNDTLVLTADEMTGATCVFFQGDASMAPVPVDDGLGCVTGSIVRLASKPIASTVSTYPQAGDLPISVRGALPPSGGTRYYQAFYRNAVGAYCPPATSNRTNGVAVVWLP